MKFAKLALALAGLFSVTFLMQESRVAQGAQVGGEHPEAKVTQIFSKDLPMFPARKA